jgi:two-component system sensor histidine kinase/response regulator
VRTSLGRILIVDDELALVEALCRTLQSQGYSTAGAASGQEALDMLRSAKTGEAVAFDILITDLMMPVMGGIALLRAARDLDSNLMSIVMTGHGTVSTAVDAMNAGALDYILKPFNLSVARPVLSRALTMRKLRVENDALVSQVAARSAELEESNRQLQTANKDLDAYNSSVSHDIRGHLNQIIGFSQIMRDGKSGELNSKQQSFLEYICGSGQQILQLTDDLLRFARLGQQPILKERVVVGDLIQQSFNNLQRLAAGTPVELRMSALPDAFADPALLKQVFVNLLSNAIKFSRHVAQPTVTVEGCREGGECSYRVSDNGAGFDMAHADRLFKRFSRLHSDAEFSGAGVGLSIVQRIVERHGGRITADAGIGIGANFVFTLPYPS